MSMYMFRERPGESSDFKKAIAMMKQGLEMICDLSEEMEDRYSQRGDYSYRDGGWDMNSRGYAERRSRDSRGRYM